LEKLKEAGITAGDTFYACFFISLKSKLRNSREFGVKMFGTGWDIMGLYEQQGFGRF